MKLFVVAAFLGVCSAGRLENTYLPPKSGSNGFQGGSSFNAGSNYNAGGFGGKGGFGGQSFGGQQSFGQTQHSGNAYNAGPYNGGGFNGGSTRQQSAYEQNAQILRYNNDVNTDSFAYDFETSNGIRAEASGVATNGVQSHGSFGYKSDDGQDISITYTADENGYRPQGAHLPTPPPIPEEILKSLEQNARDEAAGISDDGAYHGEGGQSGGHSGGYNAPSQQYGAPNQYNAPSNQYSAPSNQYRAPQASRPSSFPAASRQYLAPNAGPKGSGNFNPQSGYNY